MDDKKIIKLNTNQRIALLRLQRIPSHRRTPWQNRQIKVLKLRIVGE